MCESSLVAAVNNTPGANPFKRILYFGLGCVMMLHAKENLSVSVVSIRCYFHRDR